jgi:Uncharacterized protein conserved in bacteria
MKNKPPLSKDEQQLFRESVAGAKKLRQDTIVHRPPKPKVKQIAPQRLLQEQVDASYYFQMSTSRSWKRKARRATCAPAAARMS